MTFEDFDDSEIEMIRNEIEEQTHLRSLQLDRIQVSQCLRTGLLDITANAISDPFLESFGTWDHRCIRFQVRVFTDSEDTESEVLWGRVEYTVDREHANFFPVPEEYGKHVTIVFGWEFDRKSPMFPDLC